MAGFPTLKGSWPWPWIGSYCIPSCITHRPLPACQISLKSNILFCARMDVRTNVDKQTFEIHFIRSTQNSRPKNKLLARSLGPPPFSLQLHEIYLLCSIQLQHRISSITSKTVKRRNLQGVCMSEVEYVSAVQTTPLHQFEVPPATEIKIQYL